MRNMLEKEKISQDMDRSPSDAALQEYRDKNYHQLLSIIAEKVHQEKVQQEKLKAVKVRLNFEEVSQHSESKTPNGRRDLKKRLGSRHIRSESESPEPRRGRPESPRKRDPERKTMFKRLEKGVFHRLGDKRKNVSGHSDDSRRMVDDLPPESVDNYDDLIEAFLENFRQQKKCIKDLMEIHHIKQREGESKEDFVRRFKVERRDVKGAPEIMRISGFMHGITNPELIKCLYDKIPKSVDEMMRITTYFLRGEVAADVFAWKPANMTGIPRYIADHRLNIREGCPLVRQKRRSQAADKNQAIHEEAEKLVNSGIMKEVHYHRWLYNPIMVKKHDDSWRMYVDFKDLNKACPKDGYPLSKID
uniref:Reverse transcriptase domain-containing protein n=1 Tax=Tanacetum cinerariifolium TaxID=118510 RepID=A0A699J6I2_TANCI|nr:reverse transcriptase domain-containing protein [Tanacetum cinerariifolium]